MIELEYRNIGETGVAWGGRCDACDRVFNVVVVVGEEQDYESDTAAMCESCLLEALELLRSAKEGK